ncbi:MAG: gamma-butyrobetaine hydroxylase-like domain-containing protein [Acidimicrobiia bacterium]
MESEPSPASVDVDRTQGLTVTWPDGHVAHLGLEELRVRCPCADCRGRRERGLPVWPLPASPRPLRVEDAQLVGGWGLSLTWNDGHSTGIYSWTFIRQWPGSYPDSQ